MAKPLVLPLLAYNMIGNKQQVTYKATRTIPSPTTLFYVFLFSFLRFVANSSLPLWKVERGNHRSFFFLFFLCWDFQSLVICFYCLLIFILCFPSKCILPLVVSICQVLKNNINNQLALK